jgi:hypothetical protein
MSHDTPSLVQPLEFWKSVNTKVAEFFSAIMARTRKMPMKAPMWMIPRCTSAFNSQGWSACVYEPATKFRRGRIPIAQILIAPTKIRTAQYRSIPCQRLEI